MTRCTCDILPAHGRKSPPESLPGGFSLRWQPRLPRARGTPTFAFQVTGFSVARPRAAAASEGWWALVDDLRTLPLGQIAAGIPHVGGLSLL